MTPIFPAFNGLVPPGMTYRYPKANVSMTGGWSGLPSTYFLEPTDPLFSQIQAAYLTFQNQTYGYSSLYNVDL
jgi:alpha-N-acetylglucosaminidase